MSNNKQNTPVVPTADKLRPMGEKETISRTRTAFGEKNDKVRAVYTLEYAKKTYVVENSVIDFEGVSATEILELAANPIIIRVQNAARIAMHSNFDGAISKSNYTLIRVRDMLDAQRKAKVADTPMQAAEKLLPKLTPQDKAALLALLKLATE